MNKGASIPAHVNPECAPVGDLEWLYGLQMRGVKLGLTNVTELLRRMGDPHRSFPCIHVAGSDGKGSTCAILASVLRASGMRVGLYTSPHILAFNERIDVGGEKISDAEMADIAPSIRGIAEGMRGEGMGCTFFEATTALAFEHFRRREVDVAVIEVGMGGRLDATNVVTPLVSVISNISLEHREHLGATIEEIALEKAGIIKPGVPVVTINPEPAFGVIAKAAEERGSRLVRLRAEDVEVVENTWRGPRFRLRGEEFSVSVPGRFEAEDAALAITALRQLPGYGERIEPHLREGLESVSWPCRMQRVGDGMVVDVTHTEAGSEGLARDIAEIYGKVVLVFGVLSDKDADGMCRNLARIASRAVATAPLAPRARAVAETLGIMRRYMPDAESAPTVAAAITRALDIALPGETVLVTGSFHMAEEALRWRARSSTY